MAQAKTHWVCASIIQTFRPEYKFYKLKFPKLVFKLERPVNPGPKVFPADPGANVILLPAPILIYYYMYFKYKLE